MCDSDNVTSGTIVNTLDCWRNLSVVREYYPFEKKFLRVIQWCAHAMGNQSSTPPTGQTTAPSAASKSCLRTAVAPRVPPRLTDYTCDVIYRSKPVSAHLASTETRSAHASRFAYFKHTGALCDVRSFVLSASTDAAQEANGVTHTVSRTFDVGSIGRVGGVADAPRDATYALKHFDSGAWHEYRIYTDDSSRDHSGGVLMLRCPAHDKKQTMPFARSATVRDWKIVWEVCQK